MFEGLSSPNEKNKDHESKRRDHKFAAQGEEATSKPRSVARFGPFRFRIFGSYWVVADIMDHKIAGTDSKNDDDD